MMSRFEIMTSRRVYFRLLMQMARCWEYNKAPEYNRIMNIIIMSTAPGFRGALELACKPQRSDML